MYWWKAPRDKARVLTPRRVFYCGHSLVEWRMSPMKSLQIHCIFASSIKHIVSYAQSKCQSNLVLFVCVYEWATAASIIWMENLWRYCINSNIWITRNISCAESTSGSSTQHLILIRIHWWIDCLDLGGVVMTGDCVVWAIRRDLAIQQKKNWSDPKVHNNNENMFDSIEKTGVLMRSLCTNLFNRTFC